MLSFRQVEGLRRDDPEYTEAVLARKRLQLVETGIKLTRIPLSALGAKIADQAVKEFLVLDAFAFQEPTVAGYQHPTAVVDFVNKKDMEFNFGVAGSEVRIADSICRCEPAMQHTLVYLGVNSVLRQSSLAPSDLSARLRFGIAAFRLVPGDVAPELKEHFGLRTRGVQRTEQMGPALAEGWFDFPNLGTPSEFIPPLAVYSPPHSSHSSQMREGP